MVLLSTLVYRFLCGHTLSFLLGIPRNGTIGSCVNCAGGLFLFVCLFLGTANSKVSVPFYSF